MEKQRDMLYTSLRQAEAFNAQTDTQLLEKIQKEKVDGFGKVLSIFNFVLAVFQKRSAWDAGSITREINRLAADVVDTFFPGQDKKMRADRFEKLMRAVQNFMGSALAW